MSVLLYYNSRVDTVETLRRNRESQAKEASTGGRGDNLSVRRVILSHLNPCATGAPKRNEETLKM